MTPDSLFKKKGDLFPKKRKNVVWQKFLVGESKIRPKQNFDLSKKKKLGKLLRYMKLYEHLLEQQNQDDRRIFIANDGNEVQEIPRILIPVTNYY